ncbi:cytochrome C biogenesis protein [Nesterenkonia sp. AN1]|uniref:Cytochrome c-type biogenesis protein CcsB n=1 Tax=Nesterenkonia aurantiaca TaxID=1436010 RepID=A0A4R7G2W8_9MICC|nr:MULTISPECIES: c-type cytochrome biogenesis protein CcsB [Nesterenkonia]EXF26090.1 cytochrome C biogenesis protein [Nesterenkonia sp. AN1]TDS85430.1 cytochrome c-type biogenesis protein CcsB [Nesterenkonia aurantiaca]
MQSINMELAQYSELFMLIAAFIYTGAFMLFAVDMIRSSATIRRVEAELAAENAAERELVGAGSASGAVAAEGADAAAGPGPDQPMAAPADELVDEEMAYLGTSRPFANVAVALTVLGVAAHAFAVAARGIAANRVPWANMYEFLATGGLVVAAVYLLVLTRKDVRFLGTFALGLVVTMMAAATIGFPTPVAHVQPALQSPWIAIHVSLAVLAISLFTLTFAMNVLQLIQHRRELAQAAGETTRGSGWQFLRLVPSATSLENWAYRMNAVGFVFWTLGPLITGAIWAEEAWGRYWGWDVKEVWTFVIWVVYAGYLHARATRGWTGNRAAWLSIIGYGCIIFNYAVVNIYFPGLHSYAGLPE